ncbi:rhomboid family intramembrane serine protease [Streptomyces sp. NPDC056254]|uniref:rhomboid family intramembrane serine protease n=1 Tax=unclassified Streptomyces TaxID=2593676 RepID=UPI0004AB4B64|nr:MULTISPECIES: rhomboid family intramembrane serine protease [unclassified Streptomyces]APU41586.1 rhomboid family intramembrane serine protease [Streptomyces sp. TN58]KJK53131.1 peptidase S54 [Streptomyces sp. NRRL F-4428]
MNTTVDTGWTRAGRAKAAAQLMLGWVALLWILEVVDHATGHALDQYGIVARDPGSLTGVVSAGFLHFGFDHVASNSVPLLVLGFIAALSGIRRFLAVCGLIMLADGLGTWLISPSGTMTLGASGIVFGLFGYLLVRGFVERRALGIAVAVGVAAVWGTTIVSGVLPTDSGVSWQGHLCGLVAGVVTALYFRRPARRPAVTA